MAYFHSSQTISEVGEKKTLFPIRNRNTNEYYEMKYYESVLRTVLKECILFLAEILSLLFCRT